MKCLSGRPTPVIQSLFLGAPVTHSNRIAASAKNFLSKSQRKKRSRLERRRDRVGAGRGRGSPCQESLGMPPCTWGLWLGRGGGSLNCSLPPSCHLLLLLHPTSQPFLQNLPAQSQRGQEQHHEDEEGVALVHGGPVLAGAGAQGTGAEVRWASSHPAPPANTVSQEGPLGRGALPEVRKLASPLPVSSRTSGAGSLNGKGLPNDTVYP